jgi:hypothetical protein
MIRYIAVTLLALVALVAGPAQAGRLPGVAKGKGETDAIITVDFTSIQAAGVYSIAQAYSIQSFAFEFGASLAGTLYLCNDGNADADGDGSVDAAANCREIGDLGGTFSQPEVLGDRRWIVVDIDTAEADATPSKLTIRGSNVQVSSNTFYGLDASVGANAGIVRYEFNGNLLGDFIPLDRTNMTSAPANWETDTGIVSTNSPWRIQMSGATPSGLTALLANVDVQDDQAGNFGLEFTSDTVDNVVINVRERGPLRWLNAEEESNRKYAVEFNVAMESFDDVDFFMGVCNQVPILNSDGTIAATQYVGFHFLRSDASSTPVLTKTGGGVTSLSFPTLSEAPTGPGVGQPDPSPYGPSGYNRFAIKAYSQSKFEWYVNDQLVGYSAHDAAKSIFIELGICMAYVTNGNVIDPASVHVDRIISVMSDNSTG